MDEFLDKIEQIINGSADKELLHNNANKPSERFPTQRDMIAGEVSKLLLQRMLPTHVWEAHKSGDIHFHDSDYSAMGMTNCCLVDLESMLRDGMVVGNADISTPKSLETAVAVTAQILAQVSSHQYGGTSIDKLDEVLAPYVRKTYNKHLAEARRDNHSEARAAVIATKAIEKAVYDCMQSLEYEVNTLFNSNGQSPFVTFGFGLGASWESRLIQKAILDVRLNGLGESERTAIFPKLVFVLREGLNMKPGEPNYDIKKLAIECTSKRMYPDYISYDEVVKVTGDYKVSMGCRSFLASSPTGETSGRNNLGVVTLNLPRIAIKSKGNIDDFMLELEIAYETGISALNWRLEHLKKVQAKAAPILYMSGAFGLRLKPDELVYPHFIDRASISLGYIGCHEMLKAFFGKDVDTMSEESIEFVKMVLNFLKTRLELEKKASGIGFSLYATPSESLCDRFNRLDKEEFPEFDWLFEKGYYTNSHHLDVERKVAPNVKFDYEANFTPIATGGCISFVELPDMKKNMGALEWVIDYAASKVHYFGVNTPTDTCTKCGFIGETHATEDGYKCPSCGNKDSETLEVTRRVCGYLGNPGSRPFNPGKQHEVMGRVKHGNLLK